MVRGVAGWEICENEWKYGEVPRDILLHWVVEGNEGGDHNKKLDRAHDEPLAALADIILQAVSG